MRILYAKDRKKAKDIIYHKGKRIEMVSFCHGIENNRKVNLCKEIHMPSKEEIGVNSDKQ